MPSDRDIIILDGCTFFFSSGHGDLEEEKHEGFFFQDVRHLSRLHVLVDGRELELLTSRTVDYYSARIVGIPQDDPDDPAPISVRRDRFVSEGAHEDVVIENLSDARPAA